MTTEANRLILKREIPSNDITLTLRRAPRGNGMEVIIDQGHDNSVVLYDQGDIDDLILALEEIEEHIR